MPRPMLRSLVELSRFRLWRNLVDATWRSVEVAIRMERTASALSEIVSTSTQSQSFRLKMTYRLEHTTAIRRIANGYPSTQCNSGIRSKFIP